MPHRVGHPKAISKRQKRSHEKAMGAGRDVAAHDIFLRLKEPKKVQPRDRPLAGTNHHWSPSHRKDGTGHDFSYPSRAATAQNETVETVDGTITGPPRQR